MTPARIDILRPAGASTLISAVSFEQGLVSGVGQYLTIRSVDAPAWLAQVFGPGEVELGQAALRFREATAGASFLCPGPESLAFAPHLLRLRNHSRAPIRALIIAHAPGVFVPEWALLEPLLRPGDRIIAPSNKAAEVIELLCPGLIPHVRVIPHPILTWDEASDAPLRRASSPRRLVSLGRVVRSKLIHRQIEAMDILRRRGHDLRLDIAGPLNEHGSEGTSAYVRSLRAKIDRLGLGDRVALVGVLADRRAKLELVATASALLNYSVSPEESFGKAIAEALACGVPCSCTRWGGLDDTLGPGGLAVPVRAHRFGMDLSGEDIADAVEALLAEPPSPALCREHSRRFAPEQVAARYREVLDEAVDAWRNSDDRDDDRDAEPDLRARVPARGLLAETAPLTVLGWHEAMDMHLHDVRSGPDMRGLEHPELLCPGAHLRGLLCLGVMSAVLHVQAGLSADVWCHSQGEPALLVAGTWLDKLALAARHRGTRSSRVVVLDLLQRLGRHADVAAGLEVLRGEGHDSSGLRYVEAEAALRAGEAAEALRSITADDDDEAWGEHASHRLQQLARVCRTLALPELALPVLRRWTELYPDSPSSAEVWRQLAMLALLAGENLDEARHALVRCVDLLGPRLELTALLVALDEAS